ncbi:hypothetical protein [Polyangium sorediatum]|uniref:SMP-30/Gluconolactonase/LRE-like region domain-containing protein n=1 Tax=Polyangium sorediatum TaxID=889274 RepID=A0ABT6NUV2_9BACT|nr:hypothetical protein [Polyangium sorediatum]MDI1432083.1 hypothetical protein [Polyangium sorediatum]
MKSKDDRQSIERPFGRVLLSCLGVALASLAVACSDGSNNNPSGAGGDGGDGGSGAAGGAGGQGGEGGEGGDAPIVYPAEPEEVAKFNPALGELPEGLAIDGTTAYVVYSVAPKVVKVDLETGAVTDYGEIPGPIGIAFPQGAALDAQKNLYVAVKSENPGMFMPGIYKFPPGGGTATLWSSHPSMSFPRHIAFHSSGNAFVSVPNAARIYVVSPSGITDDPGVSQLLSGDQTSACAYGEFLSYGVTSTVFSGNTFFATNADRAYIFQGTFDGQNSEISETMVAGPDCGTLGGAESILEDPVSLSLMLAVRRTDKIMRVEFTGGMQVLAETALYEPSAMAIGETKKGRHLYVTNSAHNTYNKGGIPGLVRIPLDKAKAK